MFSSGKKKGKGDLVIWRVRFCQERPYFGEPIHSSELWETTFSKSNWYCTFHLILQWSFIWYSMLFPSTWDLTPFFSNHSWTQGEMDTNKRTEQQSHVFEYLSVEMTFPNTFWKWSYPMLYAIELKNAHVRHDIEKYFRTIKGLQ